MPSDTDYDRARRRAVNAAYSKRIDSFVAGYLPDRGTVILLPGGMGSQLDWSCKRHKRGSTKPLVEFDPAWIDLGLFFSEDARKLEIDDHGRDAKRHIIVPNGPLRFGLMDKPYDRTARWIRDAGYNYAVFGYDWRRPIQEAAGHLKAFLRAIQRRIQARFPGHDPLPATTLLCHSQGGLVAKAFLNTVASTSSAEARRWLAHVITVGTPFYGTTHHIYRFYRGQSPLNTFYTKKCVAQIVGSMPGPYALMFMDKATYDRDGAKIGLARYPLRDAVDPGGRIADPHSPAVRDRFPKWVKPGYLASAKRAHQSIARPLAPGARRLVYHVRSGKANMPVELHWRPINGAAISKLSRKKYDVTAPFDEAFGAGDNTVPFWSAVLASTPEANVYNLKKADDHQSLLEHAETLRVVCRVLKDDRLPATVSGADTAAELPRKASKQRFDRFVRDMRDGSCKIDDPRCSDPELWRCAFEACAMD